MIKKINPKTIFAFLLSLFISLLLFCSDIIQFQGRRVFIFLLLLSILSGFVIILGLRFLPKKIQNELVVASIFPFIFVLSAMLLTDTQSDYTLIVYLLYFLGFFCSGFLLLQKSTNLVLHINVVSIKTFIKRHRLFIALLMVMVIVRLPYINLLPRWDSGEYYFRFRDAVANYHYNGMLDFMDTFSLCGHPTLAFSLVYMIGEWIAPGQVIGVTITSLILTAIALCCIYRIFLHILKDCTPLKAALCTALVSMAPLFYSTSMYFNPDSTIALFFIFLVYSYVFDHPILAGLSSLMCFQTKETGLVLVGGLVIGVFIQHFLNRKKKPFFKTLFTDLRLYLTLLSTMLQYGYTKLIGSVSNWSQNGNEAPGLRWDNYGDNCLGFNPAFVDVKLKQFFLLNFNWILSLVLLTSVIIYIVHLIISKKNKVAIQTTAEMKSVIQANNEVACAVEEDVEVSNNGTTVANVRSDSNADTNTDSARTHSTDYIICPIVGAFGAFVLFSCLFITASVARYNMVSDVMLYMITFYTFSVAISQSAMLKRKTCVWIRIALSSLFGLLIITQCYFTIDPITMLSFCKLDSGNRSIYYMGKINSVDTMYYGDYLIYNTQYTYIDRAYDKLLNEIDYEPGKIDIVLPDSNGSFIAGNVPLYFLNWDNQLKKRVFYTNEHTTQMESYKEAYSYAHRKIKTSELKNEAVLIDNPYWIHVNIDHIVEQLEYYYTIGERKTIETMQGSISYYEMHKK